MPSRPKTSGERHEVELKANASRFVERVSEVCEIDPRVLKSVI
jgi:hypothetical protein